MTTILIIIIVVSMLYYLSYLFSVAASGLYLSDYDEERFVETYRGRKREFLRTLLAKPKQIAVTATLIQDISLAATVILLYLLGLSLSATPVLRQAIAILLVMSGVMIFLALVELLAPNMKQKRVLKVISSKYWLLSMLLTSCSPFVSILIAIKSKREAKLDLEDRKEEIVERAIESLADSAGIDEPLVEEDERKMIENIFDLGETEVREVMVPRIEMIAVERQTTYEELRKIANSSGYSRFPIYEDEIDKIKGVVYVKDIFTGTRFDDTDFDLLSFTRPAFFVPEAKKLDNLLEEFKRRRLHIAIVVDEFGGTAGLITLEDLLEKIVGDIQDEHDDEKAEIKKLSEYEYLVSANLSMEELSEELDLKLEEKEFETVGGYIYDLVGSVPKVGHHIENGELKFIVEKVTGQRIDQVRIILPKPEK